MDLESFQKWQQHTIFFFLSKNHTNRDSHRYNLDRNSFTNSNKFDFFFEPCSNWILSISLPKIYLRSCSNLLIFTNLRYLPLRNESTRAPSCTIYIINPSPVPQPMSFSGPEQTMSSQEHPDFYILDRNTRKNGGCKNPQLI